MEHEESQTSSLSEDASQNKSGVTEIYKAFMPRSTTCYNCGRLNVRLTERGELYKHVHCKTRHKECSASAEKIYTFKLPPLNEKGEIELAVTKMIR